MSAKSATKFVDDPLWRKVLSNIVRSGKEASNLSYQDLCERLQSEFGIPQSPDNLKSKFSKGNFGAQLLLQLVCIMDVKITPDTIRKAQKNCR